ncbi:MAG: hypothetical protein EPN62_13235 [Candidimonas sp.]|nr:MAG: hypothetical protein EPN77_11410 [Candidimonas sp.]TAM21922.1 MAG: hypothetical protein EPN62_13235 [Candidimonas sp.]
MSCRSERSGWLAYRFFYSLGGSFGGFDGSGEAVTCPLLIANRDKPESYLYFTLHVELSGARSLQKAENLLRLNLIDLNVTHLASKSA